MLTLRPLPGRAGRLRDASSPTTRSPITPGSTGRMPSRYWRRSTASSRSSNGRCLRATAISPRSSSPITARAWARPSASNTVRPSGELVTGLVEPGAPGITIDHRATEDWGHLNVAISEALRVGADRRTARVVRRALDRNITDDETTLRPHGQARTVDLAGEADASDVVVLASGNLGLISFPKLPEPPHLRADRRHLPGADPRSRRSTKGSASCWSTPATEGGLVIGGRGIRYLDHGYADR